jgi:ribosomal protein S18 acetylase RimI-like enzyme
LIEIISCTDRIEELVRFITRLNPHGEHHIGFFGEGEADARAALAECLIPPAEGFVMAYETDRLVGIFGVDADAELSRAWLLGPLVDHPDWHEIADQMYAKALPRIPVDIRDYDLFCDVENTRMQTFAARHGFPVTSENEVWTLLRENYRRAARGQVQISAYQDSFFDDLETLHNDLFPTGYFSARQMVERNDATHRLFLAAEGDQLLGYHFCKIEAESGYVDFLGTDPSARRRGIGAALLAAGLDWMFSAPTTRKVSLTVNSDNDDAQRLYERFGFERERRMRGCRKRVV